METVKITRDTENTAIHFIMEAIAETEKKVSQKILEHSTREFIEIEFKINNAIVPFEKTITKVYQKMEENIHQKAITLIKESVSTEIYDLMELVQNFAQKIEEDLESLTEKEKFKTIRDEKKNISIQEEIENQKILNLTFPIGTTLEEIEEILILKTLEITGNKTKTANILNIGSRTLFRKLELYNERKKIKEKEENKNVIQKNIQNK